MRDRPGYAWRSCWRRARIGGALALGAMASGCAAFGDDEDAPLSSGLGGPAPSRFERFVSAVSPFPAAKVYDVEFEFEGEAPPEAVIGTLRAASVIVVDQRGSETAEIALRRRARGDEDRLTRALRSEGYFEARVEADVIPASGDAPPRVRFLIAAGPRFTLAAFDIVITAPEGSRPFDAPLAPETGGPARSADILAAEKAALDALQSEGRPYARLLGREARADLETDTLRVTSRIEAGPYVQIAEPAIDGLETVERDYVEGFFDEIEGRPASRPALRQIERDLARSGLFRAAQIDLPTPPPERDGPASPELSVVEAPHRTIGGGVRYSTADGPGARAFWEHRNLRGRAERLRLEATGALELQSLSAALRKPRFRSPRQDFLASLAFTREDNEVFESLAADATVGLERQISERWSGTLGLALEVAQVDEGDGEEFGYLAGVPASIRYDGADDPLDPTRGARADLSVTPWTGALDDRGFNFTALRIGGSVYQRLDEAARFVVALRSRAETIAGASLQDVPANRRAFAGGGGSVRGFAPRFIGPRDEDGDPSGGLTAVDAALELRIRITETIGIAPFVEAGAVEEEAFSLRQSSIEYGVGLGFRYQSPIGPLRLDLAAPINPRRIDDPFQIYVGVGQAF
ncbi:MAG: autotransporter assembly complex family protein [Pseudomonadota bacterium]